jgi:hypothetical protein
MLDSRYIVHGLWVCSLSVYLYVYILNINWQKKERSCQRYIPTIIVDWTAQIFMPWVKDISRVKLRNLATQEQTFGGILDSPDIISSTCLRVRSNINDRPNHLIYHSVYRPVVLPLPPTPPFPFLHYLPSILYVEHYQERPAKHQYFAIVINIFTPMLPIDGIMKLRWLLSHLMDNRALRLIKFRISQLLPYLDNHSFVSTFSIEGCRHSSKCTNFQILFTKRSYVFMPDYSPDTRRKFRQKFLQNIGFRLQLYINP